MKKRTLALFSAAAMAAAAMTGCSNNTAQTPSTEGTAKASEETQASETTGETDSTQGAAEDQKKELVILGGSGAGLTAAIQAVNEGLDPSRILILSGTGELAADVKEKEDFINAAETAEQFQAELEDTYELYLSDTVKAGNNKNNTEMVEFLIESAEEAKGWVESLGIKLEGVEQEKGSSVARSYTAAGGGLADEVSAALVKKVEDLKISVETGVTVKEILLNADGAVTGVKAEVGGEEKTIDCIALVAADKELLPILSEMEIQLTKADDETAAGIIVNTCAEVLRAEVDEDGAAEEVPGLYAIGGLIDAGVHGDAALAGNDLTATLVFGETAGIEAAVFISDNREQ